MKDRGRKNLLLSRDALSFGSPWPSQRACSQTPTRIQGHVEKHPSNEQPEKSISDGFANNKDSCSVSNVMTVFTLLQCFHLPLQNSKV